MLQAFVSQSFSASAFGCALGVCYAAGMIRHTALPLACAVLLSGGVSAATAQTPVAVSSATPATASSMRSEPSAFAIFTPRPTRRTTLDYDVWDGMLKEMVFYSGPSLRTMSRTPALFTGTRVPHGHRSWYRLEGNKVVFEGMEDEFSDLVGDYVTDLVDIANRIDIPSLPRNEQLAFWLNLHNAVAVKSIADIYPRAEPSSAKGPDGLPFHDSKRVTIRGVALSLRDIREGIVYANWSNPNVIYGFFHGDIGGPSIQRSAFTGNNVGSLLAFVGDEYANSMRGYHSLNGRASVSRLYKDVAPWFFPDFEGDLRGHLATLQRPDVNEDLRETTGTLKLISYDSSIADLTRGEPNYSPPSQLQSDGTLIARPLVQRAIREHSEKFRELRRRGQGGTVIIEDIETTDPNERVGVEVE